MKTGVPIVCLLVLLAPCVSAATNQRANLNGGYFLLHKLCDDEAKVPLLLDVKEAPKEISDFADRVSRVAKETLKMLDEIKDHDRSLDFDKNPLPKFEQDVRESITGEKQHQLLFGTKDHDFVRAFLVSQSEASKYGANILKVLADQETHTSRAKELRAQSAKWHALYDEAFRLLRNY